MSNVEATKAFVFLLFQARCCYNAARSTGGAPAESATTLGSEGRFTSPPGSFPGGGGAVGSVMSGGIIIALVCLSVCALAAYSGWWRYALLPWTIRRNRLTVKRLNLCVSSDEDVRRVDSILASFAGGFNRMIACPSTVDCSKYCASLPALQRPFAHEGAAMGYAIRRLRPYNAREFERDVVEPQPQFRYLHYVGLGFWSGMRKHSPAKLSRIAANLDPLHRYLCFDGFGFTQAFFHYRARPDALRKLDEFDGYARNAAYQGVGRAFWFLYMGRPDLLVEHVGRLGDYAPDAAAGVGLAAVFVNPDRLQVARDLAMRLPEEWRAHFHLGMCFALKARSINDLDQFERDLSNQSRSVQDATYASIRECDRVELLVRSEGGPNGYRNWRARVAVWMTEHIGYPLTGVMTSEGTQSLPPSLLQQCATPTTEGSAGLATETAPLLIKGRQRAVQRFGNSEAALGDADQETASRPSDGKGRDA